MNFLKLLLHIGLIFTTAMTAYATEELKNDSDGTIHDSSLYNITLIHSNIRYIPNIKKKMLAFMANMMSISKSILQCTI